MVQILSNFLINHSQNWYRELPDLLFWWQNWANGASDDIDIPTAINTWLEHSIFKSTPTKCLSRWVYRYHHWPHSLSFAIKTTNLAVPGINFGCDWSKNCSNCSLIKQLPSQDHIRPNFKFLKSIKIKYVQDKLKSHFYWLVKQRLKCFYLRLDHYKLVSRPSLSYQVYEVTSYFSGIAQENKTLGQNKDWNSQDVNWQTDESTTHSRLVFQSDWLSKLSQVSSSTYWCKYFQLSWVSSNFPTPGDLEIITGCCSIRATDSREPWQQL